MRLQAISTLILSSWVLVEPAVARQLNAHDHQAAAITGVAKRDADPVDHRLHFNTMENPGVLGPDAIEEINAGKASLAKRAEPSQAPNEHAEAPASGNADIASMAVKADDASTPTTEAAAAPAGANSPQQGGYQYQPYYYAYPAGNPAAQAGGNGYPAGYAGGYAAPNGYPAYGNGNGYPNGVPAGQPNGYPGGGYRNGGDAYPNGYASPNGNGYGYGNGQPRPNGHHLLPFENGVLSTIKGVGDFIDVAGQAISNYTQQVRGNSNVVLDAVDSGITGVTAEFTVLATTLQNIFDPSGNGFATFVGNTLLNPVIDIISDNAEAVVGEIYQGRYDLYNTNHRENLKAYSQSLQSIESIANEYHSNTQRLANAIANLNIYVRN